MAPKIAAASTISKTITVDRAIPSTLDIGNLLVTDMNPLSSTSDDALASNARECVQLLLNGILSCPIASSTSGVVITLPDAVSVLPRAKPVPAEKQETKWARFARLKGITPKRREGKLVYDEASGEWVPRWGYGGKNKDAESSWLVEVDSSSKGNEEGGNPRTAIRKARLDAAKGAPRTSKAIKDAKRALGVDGRVAKVGKVKRRSRRH